MMVHFGFAIDWKENNKKVRQAAAVFFITHFRNLEIFSCCVKTFFNYDWIINYHVLKQSIYNGTYLP